MKKEKLTKKFTMVFQPTLFEKFGEVCSQNYKTPSIVIRDLITKYIKENDKKE